MKKAAMKMIFTGLLTLIAGSSVFAQGKSWKLEECIRYALDKNIQVKKADLSTDQNQINASQAQSNRLPSVNASVSQNFNWYKGFDSSTGQYGSSNGSNSTNYSMNSNLVLFNGEKLTNRVKLAQTDLEAGKLYAATVRESVGLNILNSYLQVLYATEGVANAQKQIEATTRQLDLAKERMDQGLISMADYLQIKSELATEKTTLASAQSQLTTGKVSLMQLMELPVEKGFDIQFPNLDSLLVKTETPEAKEIYLAALGFKPQIRNAALSKESSQLSVRIAKADYLPTVSMGAALSSGYSSLITGTDYTSQLRDKVNPSIGFSLSIPVFQKKQVRTNVSLAKIAVANAELDELNTRNTLRKEIEQACADAETAKAEYLASIEQNQSSTESYNVTDEKFRVGMLNSVDFLVQKTNLITSESKLLQAKFKLIFSYKVLDFYKGTPLML